MSTTAYFIMIGIALAVTVVLSMIISSAYLNHEKETHPELEFPNKQDKRHLTIETGTAS